MSLHILCHFTCLQYRILKRKFLSYKLCISRWAPSLDRFLSWKRWGPQAWWQSPASHPCLRLLRSCPKRWRISLRPASFLVTLQMWFLKASLCAFWTAWQGEQVGDPRPLRSIPLKPKHTHCAMPSWPKYLTVAAKQSRRVKAGLCHCNNKMTTACILPWDASSFLWLKLNPMLRRRKQNGHRCQCSSCQSANMACKRDLLCSR